mmetsp:Transcript_32995/g.50519  ORF Transcript_32995/g.50519 Transcript_32995/m.50519 type:complete len:124 (+) Transcript_32995:386-757(+)
MVRKMPGGFNRENIMAVSCACSSLCMWSQHQIEFCRHIQTLVDIEEQIVLAKQRIEDLEVSLEATKKREEEMVIAASAKKPKKSTPGKRDNLMEGSFTSRRSEKMKTPNSGFRTGAFGFPSKA